MTEPGNDSASDDLWLERKGGVPTLKGEPTLDIPSGNYLCLVATQRPQMPEPGKSVQLARPCLIRWRQRKRRKAAEPHHDSRKPELVSLNLGKEAGIRRTQVLRHYQQLVCVGGRQPPPERRRPQGASGHGATGASRRERCEFHALGGNCAFGRFAISSRHTGYGLSVPERLGDLLDYSTHGRWLSRSSQPLQAPDHFLLGAMLVDQPNRPRRAA